LLFALAHDAEEIAVAHDLHQAGQLRLEIDGEELRARLRWTNDAPVQHAGMLKVADITVGAGHFRRNVEAGHRPAHDAIGRGILGLRLGRNLHAETAAADQLAVAHALRRVGFDLDDAVAHAKRLDRCAEPLGGERQEAARPSAPALRSAAPPSTMPFDDPVPRWSTVVAVSPMTMVTRSMGTSSSSARSARTRCRFPCPHRSCRPTR
jgi:hypothetical protein